MRFLPFCFLNTSSIHSTNTAKQRRGNFFKKMKKLEKQLPRRLLAVFVEFIEEVFKKQKGKKNP